MRSSRCVAVPGVVLSLVAGVLPPAARAGTPVSYTGASGGNWSAPANWSPGPAPVTVDCDVSLTAKYVHFDIPGSTTIGSLAMSSLSTVNLAAGCNLSTLNDAAMNRSTIISSANFSAPTTNIDACSLNASGGIIALNAVTACNSGSSNPQWQSNGSGARVSLPGLTAVTIPSYIYFMAGAGGDFEAPNLSSVSITGSGGLILQSTGATSMVNVPALPKTLTALRVTAGTGGTVNWGNPTAVTNSDLTLDTSGTLNTASLTSIDSTNLTASNGATFNLPVAAYNTVNTTWTATGAGSKLTLPSLANVTFTAVPLRNNYLYLTAAVGGDIELPSLASFAIPGNGGLVISSTGANSTVNVSALTKTLTALKVTVGTGGTVNWGSPTAVTNSELIMDTTGTLNTASLTNIDGTTLTSTNGATFSLPVASYNTVNTTWTATRAGSKLVLPSLANVTFTPVPLYNNYLYLTAATGGDIELPSLTSFAIPANGGLVISSTGANSIVNVSALTKKLTALKVTAGTGGTVNWGSPTAVTNSELIMDTSGTLNTASLTNIDGTTLTSTNGATFSLPVTSYNTVNTTWTASGAGSKLVLPALANVTFTAVPLYNNYLYLTATSGGDVELPSLASFAVPANGGLIISSTGANSLVDLPGLLSLAASPGSTVTLGSGGGVILGATAGGDVAVSFLAKFTNPGGSLEIIENGQVLETILPNNLSTWESYQFSLPPAASVVLQRQFSSSCHGVVTEKRDGQWLSKEVNVAWMPRQ